MTSSDPVEDTLVVYQTLRNMRDNSPTAWESLMNDIQVMLLEARRDELGKVQKYWFDLSLVVPRLQASPPQVKQHIATMKAALDRQIAEVKEQHGL